MKGVRMPNGQVAPGGTAANQRRRHLSADERIVGLAASFQFSRMQSMARSAASVLQEQ
jgi:hypothetical protein